jgi:hypothetical protein
MLNILDTAGIQDAIKKGLYAPDDAYSIFINGDQFYFFQKERFSLTQEVGLLTSYGMTLSSIDFSMPLEYGLKLIKNNLTSNIVDVKKDGKLMFHGYITEKKTNHAIKYMDFTAVTFLNLLSKYPIAYADTTPTGAVSLLTGKLWELLDTLPCEYIISPQIFNRQLLDGISLGLNTGTSTLNGIDVINNLCDLLDTGIYVENNIVYIFVMPEQIFPGLMDIEPYLDRPAEVEQKSSIYYNKYSMTYKLTYNGSNEATPVIAGQGEIIKSFTPENVFFASVASAQAIVNRKLNIFSQTWHTMERNVDRSLPLKLGGYFAYKGLNYIITSIEDKYICKAIKAFGVEA